MNDEQRRLRAFWAHPEGVGPFFRKAALRLAYVATGHFRSGILLAPITAEVIADLITGAPPVIDIEAFAVQRFRSLERESEEPRP